MTLATLAREARRSVVLFSQGELTGSLAPRFSRYQASNGSSILTVTDMPVFRSGVFRDSMGYQHTWDDFHMHQMISNNELLANKKIFSDPPVRAGHASFFDNSLDTVIGYVNPMKFSAQTMTSPVDGKDYTYVLATYDIIDPAAQQNVESGLWRNRSAEVGSFDTNDEAQFWPVFMGFAYVDIPAVEGLNFSKTPGIGQKFSLMFDKETPVTGPTTDPQPPVAPVAPAVPTPPAQQVPAPVAQHTAPVAPPAQPPVQQQAPAVFNLYGTATTDFAAVQTHITTLETFRAETIAAGRKAFVETLAHSNKIAASQIPSIEAFVGDLSDDQFGKYKESWNASPAVPTLSNHAQGTPNAIQSQGGGAPTQTPEQEKLQVARETVAQHMKAGMTRDVLEGLPSFKLLKANNIEV